MTLAPTILPTLSQRRRRWLTAFLTVLSLLASALPFPRFTIPLVWEMAIAVKGGAIIVKNSAIATTCDCCCCEGCRAAVGHECANCDSGADCKTPAKLHIAFKAGITASANCVRDATYTWKPFSNLAGKVYQNVNQDTGTPNYCKYTKDITGDVGIKRCATSGVDCSCAGAQTDVSVSVTMVIEYTGGTCPDVSFIVALAGDDAVALGASVTIAFKSYSTADCTICCGVNDRNAVSLDGSEALWTEALGGGGWTIEPC